MSMDMNLIMKNLSLLVRNRDPYGQNKVGNRSDHWKWMNKETNQLISKQMNDNNYDASFLHHLFTAMSHSFVIDRNEKEKI